MGGHDNREQIRPKAGTRCLTKSSARPWQNCEGDGVVMADRLRTEEWPSPSDTSLIEERVMIGIYSAETIKVQRDRIDDCMATKARTIKFPLHERGCP